MQEYESRRSSFWPLVIVGLLLAVGVALRPRGGAAAAGQPLPPLMVEGWLNAEGPPELNGKVLVVDAWFTTCGYCLQAMPKLVQLRNSLPADRVQFIGLTFEDEAMRPQIEETIGRFTGFDWPVGYGARPTLSALDVKLYPTLILFGPNGISTWRGHDIRELERQIEQLL